MGFLIYVLWGKKKYTAKTKEEKTLQGRSSLGEMIEGEAMTLEGKNERGREKSKERALEREGRKERSTAAQYIAVTQSHVSMIEHRKVEPQASLPSTNHIFAAFSSPSSSCCDIKYYRAMHLMCTFIIVLLPTFAKSVHTW